jgi:superfamily II DNA or RNA helicase
MSDESAELRFHGGTLELRNWPSGGVPVPPAFSFDERTACHRAAAIAYPDTIRYIIANRIGYVDNARSYETLEQGAKVHREPRPYQSEALQAWKKAQGRGVVVLPTGAGKTQVALMAIDDRKRSTLVIAPTLDLVRQWHGVLSEAFGVPIGVIGGGDYDVQPITVSTYDSAYIHMERLGSRFGLLVFDECHHLPGASYALAARLSLAPFRLGLTATPERTDGKDADLTSLVGPIVYHKDIVELSGDYLAEYDTVRATVELSASERLEYDEARASYVGFIRDQGISMGRPDGWSQFIIRASRSEEGRKAMAAYQRQRELAFTAPAKLDYLQRLLFKHRNDRTLIFTQDNATCYQVSRTFLVPAITHHSKVKERTDLLTKFANGHYGVLVTSKVLNEGVDIPSANVAIILSGSGSVREHVQRLGRILRKSPEKRALLYELVTGGTSESRTSERRRDHVAYR